MATSQSSTTLSHRLPGLLVALGGLAALIAFFALTYWGDTGTYWHSSPPFSFSHSYTAFGFVKSGTDGGLSNSSTITSTLLWLVPLVGASGLLIGGARGLGRRIDGSAAASLLILAGIFGAGALVASALYIHSQTSGTFNGGVSISFSFGIGLWLALAGAVLVALGSVLSLRGNN